MEKPKWEMDSVENLRPKNEVVKMKEINIDINADDEFKQKLAKIVKRIKEKYHSEKIILFGSYAYGNPDKNSDVDLLIVKKTNLLFHKRFAQVCRIISNLRKGLSITPFVVTPIELKKRLNIPDPFFTEIFYKGKVLYAK